MSAEGVIKARRPSPFKTYLKICPRKRMQGEQNLIGLVLLLLAALVALVVIVAILNVVFVLFGNLLILSPARELGALLREKMDPITLRSRALHVVLRAKPLALVIPTVALSPLRAVMGLAEAGERHDRG
jgi:hypothetical protein